MNKQAIKDVLYGSVVELMNNPEYFYKSSVGTEFCHWTDHGEEVMMQLMSSLAPFILKYKDQEIHDAAKEMVMRGLTE